MLDVLAMVMAGGKGERLHPLTRDRTKPAVPFGGKYRLVDFVLSNMINSQIHSIYVLTQFKSQSLTEHILENWHFGTILKDHFIIPVPAQMRTGETWYTGTADAIYQNAHLIHNNRPKTVAVFGADHIYKMNIRHMLQYHLEKDADITVAAIPYAKSESKHYGVIQVDKDWRVKGFQEKPDQPATIPGRPDKILASMGNYLFKREVLESVLETDAVNEQSSHDFGRDILPANFSNMKIYVYDFQRNELPGLDEGEANDYWRDVGTIDSYWEANMDLRSVSPAFNLYNRYWPIYAGKIYAPPAKFVHDADSRRGQAINSIVSGGCIISGSTVIDSVLGPYVHLHSYSEVNQSILMENVEIGRGSRIKMAIIDKHVVIPPETNIGFDLEEDRKKYYVSPKGVVVIPKGSKYNRPPFL
ncbi:glucose-1-phosphate adenylyltransferase [candidate division KSB1 bacterium]